jgi:hypothetical protein
MTHLKTGYYQADTANGVTFIGNILEDTQQVIINAGLFARLLEDLEDGEVIVTFFDVETFHILEEIEKNYSIR